MVDFARLAAPFPPARVSWRVGSTNKDKTKGMALAYIDARDVMDRLDAVCAPAGWQCRYPHANGKTVCEVGIKVGEEWVWKADGAGDTDYEAEKGALSDAFKRAAVRFGIGRYLYDVESPWVEVEPMGKSFKIKEHEYRRLRRLLTGEPPPPEKKEPEKPAVAPRKIDVPKDGWYPLTAGVFTQDFIKIARALPTKESRQEHYMLNEPAIKALREVSSKAADNIDQLFEAIA